VPITLCRSRRTRFSMEGKTIESRQWASLFLDVMLELLVTGQGVLPAKGLFFSAELASDLLPVRIVDGVLVASKIVGSREDDVARFAGGGVEPGAFVWPSMVCPYCERSRLVVRFTSVLRHLAGCWKSLRAPADGAGVRSPVGLGFMGSRV